MTRPPLSARSVIASTLLGSDPPRLAGRLLVAIGEPFGIPRGTMRVALTRMVDRGELTNIDGTYKLRGELLQRKERQNRTRAPRHHRWDGWWHCAIVVPTGSRSAADRARLRSALSTMGFGEQREGVWMRPGDQLAPKTEFADEQVEWYRLAPLAMGDARSLARNLYLLDQWADDARTLTAELESATARLQSAGDRIAHPTLAEAFVLDAAARRLFLHDPRLPTELEPDDWPADELDRAFSRLDRSLGLSLRAFFAAVPRR
ncbi:MAG: PaaX domain-containing protein, C- domain protein [Actinomycetota bacterium]|nr:PaaX domain-containing protein, C- domain protein [Actinomycetota bacterium]